MGDEEATATAEAAAGVTQQNSQNQQTQNNGEVIPQLATPTTTQADSSSAYKSHLVVSIETMNAASSSMREKFMDFMPTPSLTQPTEIGPRPSKLIPRSGPLSNDGPITKKFSSAKNGGAANANKRTQK
ncbi:hypothetical protein PIB30_062170 [Stylosanthes scabra]|uniref:Uncharacterized protein n=1 Tax=Stylosanthes scabra TaxID=79078 RepID=A0ABU6ZJS8_9FABA|nr:hypothetical protein [Stylosanthes scabra]